MSRIQKKSQRTSPRCQGRSRLHAAKLSCIYAGTGKGKEVFQGFCKQLLEQVHNCFVHFSTVMPQLAKGRVHRDFHQDRQTCSHAFPVYGQNLPVKLDSMDEKPIDLQAVSRHLFDRPFLNRGREVKV